MSDLVEKAIALADERMSAGYLDIEDWVPLIVALVRNETLEEAARCADDHRLPLGDFLAPYKIAAAIRALANPAFGS